MSEIIVKYKGNKALQAILELAKHQDIEIIIPVDRMIKKVDSHSTANLPITLASNPNANALSGIWKGDPRTLDEVRKHAWGKRL